MIQKLLNLGKSSGKSNTAVKEKPPTTPPQAVKTTQAKGTKPSKASPKKISKVSQKAKISLPVVIKEKTLIEKYRDSFLSNSPTTSYSDTTSKGNIELVIRAAYKQVFGNAHIMDSERIAIAESQVRLGQITVRDFIRQLATSERYKALFWSKYPTPVFVELNFKHLLGRAPANYQEIAQHMRILAELGFEAEIDSYLDSDEYAENFGDFSVPFFVGYSSQPGKNNVGFTHSFPLAGTACSSDKSLYTSTNSKLEVNLIKNRPSNIPYIRPIPESYPESFAPAPEPRVAKEYKDMAFEVLKGLRNNPNFALKQRNF